MQTYNDINYVKLGAIYDYIVGGYNILKEYVDTLEEIHTDCCLKCNYTLEIIWQPASIVNYVSTRMVYTGEHDVTGHKEYYINNETWDHIDWPNRFLYAYCHSCDTAYKIGKDIFDE